MSDDHERCTCGHEITDHLNYWGRCALKICTCIAMEPEILGHPDTPMGRF